MSTAIDKDLLLLLGELRGDMKGIRDLLESNQQSTNTRIEDLTRVVDTRLSASEERITRLEAGERSLIWKVGGIGGTAGAIGAMLAEVVKNVVAK
jgi:hypothetical protein